MEFCLIISFSVLDILIFYIFFESVLIPMFLIIGIWGSRERKIKASYLFFMYTLAVPMLPFHVWLPEAHVEAPTAGSVLLAGILLKLGSYAIRQTDLKRIIAYASVAHMNFIILGIFSLTIQGLEGSIIQMISHGYHTRFINYYGGLAHTMPLFCIALFIYVLANMSIPGSSSFVGEILILTGVFEDNTTTAVFATIEYVTVYILKFLKVVCMKVYLKF
ncbi:NADH-ubiquinone oxidoreductase chain 4 [Phytophthora citrophthora]|uniref:NADH-ubiquinone oxidoreductase chain 4 n=1 Tax=Phytophthora citrophthora TaxID=4793 RepID=A0AAD9FYD8_9STRA|nr:NADH-ubiquinone oxidoreductase chain 4 [Phytophthora citrophthora]